MTSGAIAAVALPATASPEECTDAPASTNPLSGLSKLLGNRPADECPPGGEPTAAAPDVPTPPLVERGAKEEDPASDVTTQVATIDVTIETVAQSAAQLGETMEDTAFITAPEGGPPITGTVTFSFWLDDVGACTGTPTFAGTPQPVTEVLPGQATAESGPVPTSTTWQEGSYYWKASYSGDATYKPLVHECGEPNEITSLYPPNDELLMLTDSGDREIELGTSAFDTAYFDKPNEQDPAVTGTVTFNLYGPDDSDCAGPVIFSSTNPVGDHDTAFSDDFTASEPGLYRWRASYSGDVNYDPISHLCFESSEFFNVVGDPTDGDENARRERRRE